MDYHELVGRNSAYSAVRNKVHMNSLKNLIDQGLPKIPFRDYYW